MVFRRLLPLLLALSILCIPARAEDLTQEKRVDIERLLNMTGALAIGQQMAVAAAANYTQSLKKARPDIPQSVLNMLPAEVGATFEENVDSLKEQIIPIYHKYFTADEVKEMIRFYSTDLGQKMIKTMPALVREGMLVGQRWGESLGPKINQRVMDRLRKQGVKI
ncbi:MAG TPA: DUF2059 domain-containing protein [Noviherbaspirillum sp.]|nr:DUF2059 domain-containing protein [Noviherbaspirillum sp.]